jgi:KUP system potassium uptake protein
MAVWRERLFAAMHLNANLPAASSFGVPTGQVAEVGLEVEIRVSDEREFVPRLVDGR